MQKALILQHPNIAQCDLSCLPQPPKLHTSQAARLVVSPHFTLSEPASQALLAQKIDFAILPDIAFSDLGLIVSDMDSTLITIECVDEIAAGVGLKDQVAAITERSMRGELDFEQSLRERVALLAGLSENVLQEVYDRVLQLSPGAEYLISECKQHNVKFMLVSGGFTFFTQRLKERLGFEFDYANELEIENGKLTGRLKGRIIDARAKADLLTEYRQKLGLSIEQTLAMGDGANDIPMIRTAGFGIAYHAKPKTQANANACIRFNGLEAVRHWFR